MALVGDHLSLCHVLHLKWIIVYTLPLWLSRGGLADFVLNAFATVYIVELDDVTDSDHETWKLMTESDKGEAEAFSERAVGA